MNEIIRQALATLPAADWPTFEFRPISDSEISFDCIIPGHLTGFAGHFPAQPVLPGVVQLHWAVQLAQIAFGLSRFSEVTQLKYKNVILPDAAVTLRLSKQERAGRVQFSLYGHDSRYSDGTLEFEAC